MSVISSLKSVAKNPFAGATFPALPKIQFGKLGDLVKKVRGTKVFSLATASPAKVKVALGIAILTSLLLTLVTMSVAGEAGAYALNNRDSLSAANESSKWIMISLVLMVCGEVSFVLIAALTEFPTWKQEMKTYLAYVMVKAMLTFVVFHLAQGYFSAVHYGLYENVIQYLVYDKVCLTVIFAVIATMFAPWVLKSLFSNTITVQHSSKGSKPNEGNHGSGGNSGYSKDDHRKKDDYRNGHSDRNKNPGGNNRDNNNRGNSPGGN